MSSRCLYLSVHAKDILRRGIEHHMTQNTKNPDELTWFPELSCQGGICAGDNLAR